MNLLHLLFLCVYIVTTRTEISDYYWRDFDGEIPGDAFIGGDYGNQKFYIGQGYVHGVGIIIGRLLEGKNEIETPGYGAHKVNFDIKILCTNHPENFSWLRTTGKTYHSDSKKKHPVLGGYDHNYDGGRGILHVGAAIHEGELKVGAVAAYNRKSNVRIHYVHDGKEYSTTTFQVLINNK